MHVDGSEFFVEWDRWDEHRNWRLRGISEQALLAVLRNVFANVWKHGKSEGKASAVLAFDTDGSFPGSLLLTCRNPLPKDRLNDRVFRDRVEANGWMESLLQPFVKAPSEDQKSDGLGLFSVYRAVERTNGAVAVIGPWIEPWDEQWRDSWPWAGGPVDFLIGLRFRDVVR